LNEISEIVCRYGGKFCNLALFWPHIGLLLLFSNGGRVTAIAHAIIEASFNAGHPGHEILRIGVFARELISDISNLLAQWLRVNAVFRIVSDLYLTTTIGLING